MNSKGEKQNNELQDIREILRLIVERMVTKEEFNTVLGSYGNEGGIRGFPG